jgi:3-oxoadipate enol-lactonase
MTMSSLPSASQHALESGAPTQPSLVLLHALGMGAWMWRPQLPLLSNHYHILAPNLPGFGGEGASRQFSMESAAQAVIDLVLANESGPTHICGLSLGALVALQVYQAAPGLVRSLILSGGQVHPNRLLMKIQELVVSLLPERALTLDVPKQAWQHHPELVAEAKATARLSSKRSTLSALNAIAAIDFRRLLPTISVPTLVLCGTKDRANLPASRQMGAAIPHAELQIIPDVGHIWNLEKPDLFGETALRFVQQVDAEREQRLT